MGFGVKAINKATGEIIWIYPLDDVRDIIVKYGSTDEFVRGLRLQDKYPEDQYSIYTVHGSDVNTAESKLWVP